MAAAVLVLLTGCADASPPETESDCKLNKNAAEIAKSEESIASSRGCSVEGNGVKGNGVRS